MPADEGQAVVVELDVPLDVPRDNVAAWENNTSLLMKSKKHHLWNSRLRVRHWTPGAVNTSLNTLSSEAGFIVVPFPSGKRRLREVRELARVKAWGCQI